ncbi:MAG: hypothetical protein AAFY88_22625 [Acidobacteriota bacterium]
MKNLRIVLIASAFLVAGPVFAFGSSSADCNGDGQNDISCSGNLCVSVDESESQYGGYCLCDSADGSWDYKACKDWSPPTIAPAFGVAIPELRMDVAQLQPAADDPADPSPATDVARPAACAAAG